MAWRPVALKKWQNIAKVMSRRDEIEISDKEVASLAYGLRSVAKPMTLNAVAAGNRGGRKVLTGRREAKARSVASRNYRRKRCVQRVGEAW